MKRLQNRESLRSGEDKHSEMKIAPRQRRARVTIEAILDATTELLVEHGVENLSTNMICEKAGLTPPALYRYFPNKYAVLKELAVRLKNMQIDLFSQWLEKDGPMLVKEGGHGKPAPIAEAIYQLEMAIYSAMKESPANIWIARLVRTQPAMTELRSEWRARSLMQLKEYLGLHTFYASLEEVFVCASVTVEFIHSTIEMVAENEALNPQMTFRTVANMVAAEFVRLATPESER